MYWPWAGAMCDFDFGLGGLILDFCLNPHFVILNVVKNLLFDMYSLLIDPSLHVG